MILFLLKFKVKRRTVSVINMKTCMSYYHDYVRIMWIKTTFATNQIDCTAFRIDTIIYSQAAFEKIVYHMRIRSCGMAISSSQNVMRNGCRLNMKKLISKLWELIRYTRNSVKNNWQSLFWTQHFHQNGCFYITHK